MGFTSLIFLFCFFPVCITGFYIFLSLEKKILFLKKIRIEDWILVAFSIGFYAWAGIKDIISFSIYIFLVCLLGKWLEYISVRKQSKGELFLCLSVVILTSVLYYFKYYNFVAELVNNLLGIEIIGQRSAWSLLGVSFITFSAISYLVDIYRQDVNAGSVLDVALFLSFFPKVVSGPIVRWKDFNFDLLHRIYSESQFVYGINRFIIGLAKKVILADSFGTVVTQIQNQAVYGIDIPTAWGCTFLYFLQIYYDFSGYSDSAIGLAAMFGFDMKDNFKFPYISTSITEFWRRWHISLGSWFREYIYIPLGGNRKGFKRTLLNLFIVFLVTGIWHGAGIGYLIWGTVHGICVVIERCIREKKIYKRTAPIVKWGLTMFIVMLGWQFFRISGISDNIYFWKIMFGFERFSFINFTWQYFFTVKILVFVLIAVTGALLFAVPGLKSMWQKIEKTRMGFIVQEILLMLLFVVVVLFMVNSTYSPFIYFQY